jgi:hypothetical protein
MSLNTTASERPRHRDPGNPALPPLFADTLLFDSCKSIEKEYKAWISGHFSKMRESMYSQRSALMISPKRTGKRSSVFFRLPGQCSYSEGRFRSRCIKCNRERRQGRCFGLQRSWMMQRSGLPGFFNPSRSRRNRFRCTCQSGSPTGEYRELSP